MMTAAATLTASPAALPQLSVRSSVRQQLRGMAVDTAVPLGIYSVARHAFGMTEVHALLLTAVQPVVASVLSLRRERRLSPPSVLVFAGIVVGLGAMLLGGSAQVLLLRESLLTVVLGVACLASLPAKRPLMFFFIRHFQAGSDPAGFESFNARVALKPFRQTMRRITAVWGVVLLAEFFVRALLVMHCSAATVLAVSPVLLNGVILATIAWSVWYGKQRVARFALRG